MPSLFRTSNKPETLTDDQLRKDIVYALNDYCPKFGAVSRRGLATMVRAYGRIYSRLSHRQLRVLNSLVEAGVVSHEIQWYGKIWFHVYKPIMTEEQYLKSQE